MVMKRKQYKRKSRRGGPGYYKKKYPKKASTKRIQAVVKRELGKEIETKCAPLYTLADQLNVYGAGLNPGLGLGWVSANLIPPISSGTGDGQRVGNKVRVKGLYFNYTIRANAVMATNNFTGSPFMCRVIIYKQRYATDDSSPLQMLDSGNSAQNFGSTPDDYIKPYNKKMFQIFYSKQYLMQPIRTEITTPISTENVANGTVTFASRRVRVKIPYKTLLYADTTTLPTNAGLYAAVVVCNADGIVVNSTSTRVMLNAESLLYYTDA